MFKAIWNFLLTAFATFAERLPEVPGKVAKRLAPFADPGFWVLTLISLIPLFFIDRAMAVALLQWCAFFLALAGASIVICRVLLPQVDLSEWLMAAWNAEKADPRAAATVFMSVCILLSAVLLAMVLWAKG